MKNRVAKLTGIGKVKIFEEELRDLKKGEVLVAIKAVGICGSDMHYFREGGLGSFKQSFPMYVGHEPSGQVMEIFSKGKFNKGDRVAIEPSNPCLSCEWCKKERYNLCLKSTFMAADSKTQGSVADYIIVNEKQLVKIPKNMSYKMAALLEPLGVALHATNLINLKSKENAVIFGAGAIGLSLMSVLKKKGLKEIYIVDKLLYRVNFAKKMGATRAFLFRDSVEQIKNITKNKGMTYAFDAAGNDDSINACINTVKIAGTISLVGIPIGDFVKYNPHKLRLKEITLQNVRRSNQTLEELIKIYKKNDDIEQIVTHEFDIEKVQNAFDLVSNYKDKVIKCMITNKK